MKDQTCQERVKDHYEDRISDLHKLWQAYSKGEEEVEDLGNIFEYGLAFDYVPFTEDDDRQEPGYFRYQLSTGGPGDEFRFFCDAEKHCYKVEYWFLDWYDGARFPVHGDDLKFMKEIFDWFAECGSLETAMEAAQ